MRTPAEELLAAAAKVRQDVEYRSRGVDMDSRDRYDLAVAELLEHIAATFSSVLQNDIPWQKAALATARAYLAGEAT